MTDAEPRARFWLAFLACAAATLAPLWAVTVPPMVDLPQHAAQVSIWRHLDDPAYGFAESFRIELATPYLASYALARAFAAFTSVRVALKLEITLTMLALPLALLPFLRRAGVSRWWSLVGFPLAYGYSFRWGFLNFMLGVPIALLYLPFARGYAERPTARAGVLLALFTTAFLAIHPLLLGFCAGAAGLMIVAESPGVVAAARRASPLVAPLPLVVPWLARDRGVIVAPTVWDLGPHRLADLFALFGYRVPAMAAVYIALVGAVVVLRARRDVRARDAAPLALAAALVLFWPFRAYGTGFNVFLVPLLVAWLRPAAPRALRLGLVGLTILVAAVVWPKFRAFDADARDYDAVAASIPPRPRIRPLIFLPGEAREFLHFPAWTQADKGGVYGFSFANSYTVARTKPGAPRLMGFDDEHRPWAFDYAREADAHYDTFVVRSDEDPASLAARLFPPSSGVTRAASAGKWHVFLAGR
jgi:hypothetical protein